MFRIPIFGVATSISTCRILMLAGFVLLLASGSVMAESAYTLSPMQGSGNEITDWAPRSSKWKKLWKWSAAALVAGSAMDIGSSWGYPEANGLLRSSGGQLRARGTGIKFGVIGATLVGQHYLLKKHPEMEKSLAITNFAVGAAYTGVSVRNWRVR